MASIQVVESDCRWSSQVVGQRNVKGEVTIVFAHKRQNGAARWPVLTSEKTPEHCSGLIYRAPSGRLKDNQAPPKGCNIISPRQRAGLQTRPSNLIPTLVRLYPIITLMESSEDGHFCQSNVRHSKVRANPISSKGPSYRTEFLAENMAGVVSEIIVSLKNLVRLVVPRFRHSGGSRNPVPLDAGFPNPHPLASGFRWVTAGTWVLLPACPAVLTEKHC
jgi:hypothetical protein